VAYHLTPAHEAFRAEVRSYVSSVLPEVGAEGVSSDPQASRRFFERLGADGWLGLAWPRSLGGQERSAVDVAVFEEECFKAGAPMELYSLTGFVGNALLRLGTPQQVDRFIPEMIAGNLGCCLGYSEPDAGSDLAALRTRAVRDGSTFVVDGRKVWTSEAHVADFIFLVARSDPQSERHHGISLVLVPTTAAGLTINPISTVGGVRLNECVFDSVRVPEEALVGTENEGWKGLMYALDVERSGTRYAGWAERLFSALAASAATTTVASGDGDTSLELGRLWSQLQVGRLFAYRVAFLTEQGQSPTIEAAIAKLFVSESILDLCDTGMDLLGPESVLTGGAEPASARGLLEWARRYHIARPIAAGSSEVQRTIIAQRGLGLPRGR
jgi:alkylation response protein AidB-like acyl-CoA dehydrogenase